MSNTGGRAAALMRAAWPLAAIMVVAVVLRRFPPEEYGFYPQCPVYALLHIQCPGCGTTRALAVLLGGHLMEAMRLNALSMSSLPVAAGYAMVCYRRYLRREPFRWPQLPPATLYAALAVAALFTVLRNLPLRAL